jgi:hypothetical protein
MQLSPLGQVVNDEWMRSVAIRKEIQLYEDEFVVMPNHVHGIVWMVDPVLVGAQRLRPIDPTSNKTIPANPNQTVVIRSNRGIDPIEEDARRAPLRGMSLGRSLPGLNHRSRAGRGAN